ncbi:MAG: hypothetical protein ACI4HI_02610 [Lachnospiraceae bacterium]
MGSMVTRQRITNTNGDRQFLRERELEKERENAEKEDFLLHQIDEFRDKAKQLQALVAKKENKVQELQSIVDESEDKAEKLKNILNERQTEADKVLKTFEEQVKILIDRVQECVLRLDSNITEQIKNNSERTGQGIEKKISAALFGIQKKIEEQIVQFDQTFGEDTERLSGQIEEQIKELEDRLDRTITKTEKITSRVTEQISDTEALLEQLKVDSEVLNHNFEDTSAKTLQQMREKAEQNAQELQKDSERILQQMQTQTLQLQKQLQEMLVKQNQGIREKCEKTDQDLQKKTEEIKEILETIKNTLEEEQKKNDSAKEEIIEKMHIENVNIYGEMQKIREEFPKKFDEIEENIQDLKGTKLFGKISAIFSALTFIVVLLYIIFSMGLI